MEYNSFILSDLPPVDLAVKPATTPAEIALEWSKDFEVLGFSGPARFWRDISRAFRRGHIIVGPALDFAIKDAEANQIYGTSDIRIEARILTKALRTMK